MVLLEEVRREKGKMDEGGDDGYGRLKYPTGDVAVEAAVVV